MNNVAILIPCLNSASTLAETLESILESESLAGSSIILLDGGSTDYTFQLYRHFAENYSFHHMTIREFPGVHPAERINILLDEGDYEYYFLCHSDDIYIPSAMRSMLNCIASSSLWALGSQNGFFQHPGDAAAKNSTPYVGTHNTHPHDPDAIYCEMPFWWSISWNSILLKRADIASASIRLDPARYKYCNDYRFNWELAKRGKIGNVPFVSVLTRHRGKGDGPLNSQSLSIEISLIQSLIRVEADLQGFLGEHLSKVLGSISFQYGSWTLPSRSYPLLHYEILAERLEKFSGTSSRRHHYSQIAQSLEASLGPPE